MEQTAINSTSIRCAACDITFHPNNLESHNKGKKHILKQEEYDKVHKGVFVSGTSKLTNEDLRRKFKKFGRVSQIRRQNNSAFAFIIFEDELAVNRATKARVFAGDTRLFVRKYDSNKNMVDNSKDTSKKSSETIPNTPENDIATNSDQVADLPVELPNPSECPKGQNLLEWQVQHFISQVEFPDVQYQTLSTVASDIEEIFAPVMPGCRVLIFGSCGSTLAFKNSDVDLFLQSAVGEQPKEFVKKEARLMYKSRKVKVTARIPSARVPIVKFEHIATGLQCDLTANSRLGVCNSRLIRFLISLDPRIRPLLMVIKYWAKVCEVTGSTHRMTTYSLVMMVVFYLQQVSPPILPPVALLQQLASQKEFSLDWECSFCDEEWTIRAKYLQEENKSSLKELLTGFFKFYDEYDYNNVICPLLGRGVPISDFEDPDKLPNEMQLYKERWKNNPKLQFRTNVMLRLQDPFELFLNITRNVLDRTVITFKNACRVSLEICQQNDESRLLNELFSIDKSAIQPENLATKIFIPYRQDMIDSNCFDSKNEHEDWFASATEAVLLVLKEVFKLRVEPANTEVLSKVKRLESSKDVHTTSPDSKDGLVYICSGNSAIWNSRKKIGKLLNSVNVPLSMFEKEVCISRILHASKPCSRFSFQLEIIPRKKSIEIQIKDNTEVVTGEMKEILNFVRHNMRFIVVHAAVYLGNLSKSSPVSEVKEAVEELFNLEKVCSLVLEHLKGNTHDPGSACTIKENKKCALPNESVTKQNPSKGKQPDMLVANPITTTTHSSNLRCLAQDTLLKPFSQIQKYSEYNDEEMINEPQCSNNNSTAQTLATTNESRTEDVTTNRSKFCKMFENMKPHKTESSFTCQEIKKENPFLAAIEKKIKEEACIDSSESSNVADKTKCYVENKEVVHKNQSQHIKPEINELGNGSNVNRVDEPGVRATNEMEQRKNSCNINESSHNFLQAKSLVVTNKKMDDTVNPVETEKKSLTQDKPRPKEKKDIGCTSGPFPGNKTIAKEDCKSGFKPIQQKPKVYLERPHKFRKPINYKPPQSYSTPHEQHSEISSFGVHKKKVYGPYGQQAHSRRPNSTNSFADYQYYGDYVDSSRTSNLSRNQRHLPAPINKQKLWYPSLFNRN